MNVNIAMFYLHTEFHNYLMKTLLIGDVHFGCRSNNISWLELQLEFFEKQVIPEIESGDYDNVVFLGDVFDIRYSINEQVGIEVKDLFRKLSRISREVIIVAGNHDYYSPLQDFQHYNAYSLVFGPEFVAAHPNLHFITDAPYFSEGMLFLPWYWTEDINLFKKAISQHPSASIVICHTDLSQWPQEMVSLVSGKTVYSGHIHYPWSSGNLHNLGACCAFNFNDVNQTRCLYVVEDGKITRTIENIVTPKFKRFYNEEIFTLSGTDFENSIVQFCISQSNITSARYKEQIKELKSTYINSSIKLNIFDDNIELDKLDGMQFNTNIDRYIEQSIPEHLSGKYNIIKEQLKEQSTTLNQ